MPTDIPGLDLAPSHIDLSAAELELVSALAREYALKRAIDKARLEHRFVIIDCPPSLGLLTLNALVAAHEVLIPVQCEFYALAGLAKLLDTVGRIRVALNADLAIAGAVLTMYDARTNLSKEVAGRSAHQLPRACVQRRDPAQRAPGRGAKLWQAGQRARSRRRRGARLPRAGGGTRRARYLRREEAQV